MRYVAHTAPEPTTQRDVVHRVIPRGVRLFAAPREEPRARRASDVILLVLTLVTLVVVGMVAEPPSGFEQAVVDLVNAIPDALDGLWQLFWDLPILWMVALVAVALVRKRGAVARDMVLSILLAAAGALVTIRVVQGAWPDLWDELTISSAPPSIPAMRLAIVTAAAATIHPHLSHVFRRLGRLVVVLAACAALPLGVTTPSGVLAALCIGGAAAAAVHLVFGSTAGRPGLNEIQRLLAELGIAADALEPARRQPAGVFVVRCESPAGPLAVKVYGRDAWDTQLLARVWRALWYRSRGGSLRFSRLSQAEHEAFLALHAANNGVRVPKVVTAGLGTRGDAVLVVAAGFVPFADLTGEELTDELLRRTWDEVGELHVGNIAHRALDPTRLAVAIDGGVVLLDFDQAVVSPTHEAVLADLAQVLVASAVLVGHERALAIALDRQGREGLAAIVPYVQMAALTEELRDRVKAARLDLDDLRDGASDAAGIEAVELAKLRRITPGTIVRVALLGVAAYALISALGGIDFQELVDEMKNASWALLAVGLLFGQTPRFAQAISTLGASPAPLPYGPVAALQFAITFVNLAIPSTAARVAVNVRFFQRQGVPGASAVSVGALDGFAGFLIQIAILLVAILFDPASIQLSFGSDSSSSSSSSGGPSTWVVLAVVLLVAGVVVVLVVPKLRHKVVSTLKTWITQAWQVVHSLTLARVVRLLGGNLLSELLFATTLSIFCAAYDEHVPLATLLVINVVTALFAGFMPVPGGIGVTEAALMAGLTSAGVSSATAFAIVISYRLAVFYLPPIWGAAAFRWLERNKYL